MDGFQNSNHLGGVWINDLVRKKKLEHQIRFSNYFIFFSFTKTLIQSMNCALPNTPFMSFVDIFLGFIRVRLFYGRCTHGKGMPV